MKKYQNILLILLTMGIASSCATTSVERNYFTSSGSPEVTVNAPKEEITNYLLGVMANYNLSIVSQSTNNIILERPVTGNETFAVALTIGNSYSSNSRVSNLSFYETSSGIRVIWKQFYKAMMPGGQVNERQLTDNALFNMNMETLLEMKAALEN
jgi:hypothetical protein